jgi:hypothetical protein
MVDGSRAWLRHMSGSLRGLRCSAHRRFLIY